MKKEVAQKIKTGVFALIGIAVLVIGIFIIGSNKNMFNKTYKIFGTFNNIGGLQVGNNVMYSGINAGTVETISLVSDTIIRVDLRIKESFRPFLKVDAMATVGSAGLMGDKLIMIAAGSPNETSLLKDGSEIRTMNPVGFEEIITKFTYAADNAGIITKELADMAVQIRKGNGTISKLLYTDDLSRSLEATAKNAQTITQNISGITAKINSGQGSIGSLVHTNALTNNIDSVMTGAQLAMINIQDAAYGFSENMKALQGNFLFRGYFKRKAKAEAVALNAVEIKELDELESLYLDPDLNEAELKKLIIEAQKALEAKKVKN
ncbi:MAG TPA: MlaD family protein [Phnomibacter sp.]|nr:MlaD family protein [Phnomibacter sp.]